VQSADLAPTLLDFVDARPRAERRADASGPRSGRSLEPLAHGWHRDAPHESLLLVSGRHVALRTADWKLIAPVARPWEPQIEFAELYALAEDPAERSDLAADGSLGPVGRDLMGELSRRLPAPARLAAGAPR
jgi:arylsulfatase A-like enzyme